MRLSIGDMAMNPRNDRLGLARRALGATALGTALALLAACGGKPEGRGELSGTLVTAPGQSIPAGMPIELELVALADAAAPPLATTTLEWADGAETPFRLDYDAAGAHDGPYLLRARAVLQKITYLEGQALAPVPAPAQPLPVDLLLRKPANAPPLYLDVSVLRLGHKRAPDWARELHALMPAIQVCLRSVSGQGITVTRAAPAGGGRIAVRIRAADGSGFDCVALPDGSKFESLAGLPSFAAKLDGEGEPAFVPAPATPKMSDCHRYERVLGGLDEPLGWLVYRTCPPEPPAG